jgi:hypothetical protein
MAIRAKALRACIHCHEPFFASTANMIYCSKRCKTAREHSILEEKRRRLRDAFLSQLGETNQP